MLITGTNGADTLTGTLGDDVINSLGGRDTINATQGHDIVDGGPSINDRLTIIMSDGARFADAASGPRTYTIDNSHVGSSAGGLDTSFSNIERVTLELNDTGDFGDTVDSTAFTGGYALDIRLGNGDDFVYGGSGNETVYTRLGINWVDSGGGFDTVFTQADFAADNTVLIIGSGNQLQTVHNGIVTNTILNAEQVFVGNNVDAAFVVDGLTYTIDATGYTGSAQVVFYDHNGDDIFLGSAGSDIFSNLYNATVGNDTYTGNGGADIFDYTVAVNALNNDVITDFDNDDIIDFQYNDGITVPGQLLATSFIGGAAFSGIIGEYRYASGGGQTYVQIDTDGDAVADRTLTLSNGTYALVETAPGSNILMRANLVNGDATGNIFLTGTLGNDVINGLAGVDRIFASQGIDFVDGGTSNDRLTINTFDATLFTAATGARSYTITTNRVTDSSGTLNTTMTSIERITFSTQGSSFNDTVDVSGFVSSAPSGIVTLLLGNGDNTVIGSNYGDNIVVGTGHNVIDGGAGHDDVQFRFDNSSGATLYITGSGGTIIPTLNGVVLNTLTNVEGIAVGGTINAAMTIIDASALTGIAGRVVFIDTNGTDIMIGHAGADFFSNSYVNTVGNDTFTGNGGADIYDYTFAVGGMDGDHITDFDADDVIDLTFNNATSNGGGLLANQFIGTADFTGVAGQYRYFAYDDQTFVQVDTNGDTIADEMLTIGNGQFALAETAPGSNLLHIIGASGTGVDDFMEGTLGNDTFYAQGGDDIIAATGGMDFNYGGDGFDQLRFVTANAERFVAPWDSRTFTFTNEWVGASDGTINSYHFDIESLFLNTLGTGDFGDTIDASALTSAGLVLRLGAGNDTVIGGAGDDDIGLNLGINVADAGAGYDIVYTAFDNTTGETAYVTSSGGTVIVTVGGIQVASIVNAESVQITGYFASAITTTTDASGYTAIAGVQLVLRDSNGSDTIIGSNGSDVLANVSNNTLGNDVWTGNGGADIFDYTYASNGINGDTITDFDSDDVIDFRFNDGTVEGASPLLCTQFIGNAAFTSIAGQYRYEVIGGQAQIQVDTDGNGIADQVMTIANGAFGLVETAAGSNILMRANLITDSDGDDFSVGGAGNDVIHALAGNDFIAATRGIDFVDGGAGFDQLRFLMANTSRFTAPTESRTYTITAEHVSDSSGQLNTSFTDIEQVYLSTVNAGNFGDTIDGSASNVSLMLRLGNGNDTVVGSAEDDDITTGLGINSVDAGEGDDLVVGQYDSTSGATAYVTFDGTAVVTTVNGVATNMFVNAETVGVQGSDFNTAVTTVDASGLTGFTGLFVFYDHNGTNISIGSAGSDMFANVHGGETGDDVYTGNGGADIYDYTYAVGAMDRDRITDFDADDVIDLSHNTATQNGGGLLATTYLGSSAFTGVAGQYRYFASGGQTFVQIDTNGDMVADETLTIANGEFVLAETSPGSNQLKIGGIVADGYVVGATLFIDTNGNQTLDAGEASTVTGAGGTFTLNQAGTLVAIGGTNIDTGLANTMTLAAPSGSGVVNPLTTLIQAVVEQSNKPGAEPLTVEQAQTKVLAALGLDPALDLLNLDLIAAAAGDPAALEAQKAAAMIANLVSAAEGTTGAGANTELVLVNALADLVTDTGAGATIDLTSTATLTPLLTEALPGVADIAAIASEVAVEGEAISAATSVDAISDAQLDAHDIDYSLDNVLNGDDGDNYLFGGDGHDTLYGGQGSDTLKGGDGLDHLYGGAGDDVFVAEVTATEIPTKLGTMSFDVIFDFVRGDDLIDLSGLDANANIGGHQSFNWKGSNANKAAGDLSFKVYASVQGAEKALGFDIDGVAGASPYSGPVTIVYGNVDGGSPDFALALIGVNGVTQSDFLFV